MMCHNYMLREFSLVGYTNIVVISGLHMTDDMS
jgi:hypothetical protein